MHPIITTTLLDKSLTYQQYRKLIDDLLAEGKVTGAKQSETLLYYSKLNVTRMNRLDKTVELQDSLVAQLKAVTKPLLWLVLTEGWCGDSAQNLPAIVKMAEQSALIQLRMLLRDENLSVMDQYLTNGGRAIPKLVCLRADTSEELGTWGPKPLPVKKMLLAYKENPLSVNYEEFSASIQLWYAKDKTLTLQAEFETLLAQWNARLNQKTDG